ncbi:MAG: hypothetical protein FJY85_21340 [Deltaproteobacteria bacterium]|nr:hypothetical protein [Deltaproteobacteria bacterium]
MQSIVVTGASEHAKVVMDVTGKQGQFAIAGLVDTYKVHGHTCFGYSVLGDELDLPAIMSNHRIGVGIVAIGDNWTRAKEVNKILWIAPDFQFITAAHPSATLARGRLRQRNRDHGRGHDEQRLQTCSKKTADSNAKARSTLA